MAEKKIFTPDFSAKGDLLAGSQYAALNTKQGKGRDLSSQFEKGGETFAANLEELKAKIKAKREEELFEDELDLVEIEEEEEVFDDEEEAAADLNEGLMAPGRGQSLEQRASLGYSSPNKKTSSPWKKTSSVMKKYSAGNAEEQIIRDSFGWGTRNRDERGADLGKYIYDKMRPHVLDLRDKFQDAQHTDESTHSVIGEASDITNKGLWGVLPTEAMWDIDNIVGQEPGMLEMNFDSETNQMGLRVAQLDGGYKNVSLTDFSDIIKNNIQPAAKKKEHFETLANLRQLGIDGKSLPDNLVETKLNQITPKNIAQLMLNPVYGAQSFVEEAEHDSELKDLDISAKEVYHHVLENSDDPETFKSAQIKLAEYWAAKEEEAYNKGRDIRNQKNKELKRSFAGAGSGMGGVQREEGLNSPMTKKTAGMTTSQKIQYYKNL